MKSCRVLLLLALALVLGAGCAGDEPAGRASFADRLALLPRSLADDADEIMVQMGDLDRAAELAGIERPADTADGDAAWAYLRDLSGQGTADRPTPEVAALLPSLTQQPTLVAEFEAELGWSAVDVDWYIEYSTPPAPLAVIGGGFDEERLTEAMGAPEDGRWRVGEGEDLSVDPGQRTAARPLGRPLTLALASDRLLVSPSSGAVEAAASGGGDTLAEVAELRALAAAMDAEGAYSAVFSSGGSYRAEYGPQVPPEVVAELASGLQEFTGVATGLAHDGQPFVVVAYAHADAAAAAANAGTVRTLIEQGRSYLTSRPWSDLLAVDEIRVDGTTVVARLALRDAHPTLAYDLLWSRDSLVVHS